MKIRALILAAAFMVVGSLSANAQTFSVFSSVIGSGGQPMQGGNFKMDGTFGQPIIGPIGAFPTGNGNGIGQGFWYTLAGLAKGSVSTNIGQPNGYALAQNYPNPFNPSTKIQFSVPERTKVTLRIMNLLGEEVRREIDNEVYEPGTWEIDFNAKDLPSGTYVYRLEAGNVVMTKKMVLMK